MIIFPTILITSWANLAKEGLEVHTDYRKMLEIVKEAGYTGHIGIEYEGSLLDQFEGIRATKALLEKLGTELSA